MYVGGEIRREKKVGKPAEGPERPPTRSIWPEQGSGRRKRKFLLGFFFKKKGGKGGSMAESEEDGFDSVNTYLFEEDKGV